MREYYKQLYANKSNDLEEMNKFLERHKLPKFSQEGIGNTNSPESTNITEFLAKKNFPQGKL